jgi:hypothetical protein
MTTMKKPYEKPAMQVFELKQQPQLLAGSSGNGTSPYIPQTPDTW